LRRDGIMTSNKEEAMPMFDAFVVAGIVLVFVVFGAGLAWAEVQTRNLPPQTQRAVRPSTDSRTATVTPLRKQAA